MKKNRRPCRIQTNVTDEEYNLIKDEYGFESLVYDLLKDIDLNEKQYKRLNEELHLIRLSGSFKTLYIAYLLTYKIKENGRNYCLLNISNDLLINYLLGISKVDPLDSQFLYELPYEPCLGIAEKPKKMFIQIRVSPDCRQTLADYLQRLIKEEYKDDGLDAIRISLLENEKMKILDENKEHLSDYDPSEAFGLLVDSCLEETNSHFISRDGNPYKYYGMTFWDFCLSICKAHNTTKHHLGTELLSCREDVWKMLERCDITDDERYTLYKNICKHIDKVDDKTTEIIRKSYPYDCNTICRDITNFYYIYPIGASIEDVYNEAKIAWIRKRKESE